MNDRPNLLLSFIKSKSKIFVFERYYYKSYKDNIEWQNISRLEHFYDDIIICSICLNEPVLPRMDKCGHIFCLSCLLNLCKHEQKNFVLCPVCKNYNINVSESKRVSFTKFVPVEPGCRLHFDLLVKGNQSMFPDYYFNLVAPLQNAPFASDPHATFSNIAVDRDDEILKIIKQDITVFKRNRINIRRLNGKAIVHETKQFLCNEIAEFRLNISIDSTCILKPSNNEEKSLDCFNFLRKTKDQLDRFTLFFQCIEGRFLILEPQITSMFLKRSAKYPCAVKGTVLFSRNEKVTQSFINQTKLTHLPMGAIVTIITLDCDVNNLLKDYPLNVHVQIAKCHKFAIFKEKKILQHTMREAAAKRKELERKGIMFTPMIDDSLCRGVQEIFVNRLSEDTNPSSFNLCMFGMDCEDPDDDYPHDEKCKYYKEWLEDEEDYWYKKIGKGFHYNIGKENMEDYIMVSPLSLSNSMTDEATTPTSSTSSFDMLDSTSLAKCMSLDIEMVEECATEDEEEMPLQKNIVDITKEMVTEPRKIAVTEKVLETVIDFTRRMDIEKNYPPDNIKDFEPFIVPQKFTVITKKKTTQRQEKNHRKELKKLQKKIK